MAKNQNVHNVSGKFLDSKGRVRTLAIPVSADLAEDIDTVDDVAQLVRDIDAVSYTRELAGAANPDADAKQRTIGGRMTGKRCLELIPELAALAVPMKREPVNA